jgi:hypothetical protein
MFIHTIQFISTAMLYAIVLFVIAYPFVAFGTKSMGE